jgi:hypothetical protein
MGKSRATQYFWFPFANQKSCAIIDLRRVIGLG